MAKVSAADKSAIDATKRLNDLKRAGECEATDGIRRSTEKRKRISGVHQTSSPRQLKVKSPQSRSQNTGTLSKRLQGIKKAVLPTAPKVGENELWDVPPQSPERLRTSRNPQIPETLTVAEVDKPNAIDPEPPARRTRSHDKKEVAAVNGDGVVDPESPARNTRSKVAASNSRAEIQVQLSTRRGENRGKETDATLQRSTPGITDPEKRPRGSPSGQATSQPHPSPPSHKERTSGAQKAAQSSIESVFNAEDMSAEETEEDVTEDEQQDGQSARQQRHARNKAAINNLECEEQWSRVREAAREVRCASRTHKICPEMRDLYEAIIHAYSICQECEEYVASSRRPPTDLKEDLRKTLDSLQEGVANVHQTGQKRRDEQVCKDIYLRFIPALTILVRSILTAHYQDGIKTASIRQLDQALAFTISLCDKAFHWQPRPDLDGRARLNTKNIIKVNLMQIRSRYKLELAVLEVPGRQAKVRDSEERRRVWERQKEEKERLLRHQAEAEKMARRRLMAEQYEEIRRWDTQMQSLVQPRATARPSIHRQPLTEMSTVRLSVEDVELNDEPDIVVSLPAAGSRESHTENKWTQELEAIIAEGLQVFRGIFRIFVIHDKTNSSATEPSRFTDILKKYGSGKGPLSDFTITEIKAKALEFREAMEKDALENGASLEDWEFIRSIKV